jgi:hypothetical protein
MLATALGGPEIASWAAQNTLRDLRHIDDRSDRPRILCGGAEQTWAAHYVERLLKGARPSDRAVGARRTRAQPQGCTRRQYRGAAGAVAAHRPDHRLMSA